MPATVAMEPLASGDPGGQSVGSDHPCPTGAPGDLTGPGLAVPLAAGDLTGPGLAVPLAAGDLTGPGLAVPLAAGDLTGPGLAVPLAAGDLTGPGLAVPLAAGDLTGPGLAVPAPPAHATTSHSITGIHLPMRSTFLIRSLPSVPGLVA